MDTIKSTELPILIVDDNAQYLRLLKTMLEYGFGYKNITAASDPDEGYALVANDPNRFSLIFVDYWFPGGMTGGDLLKRLQSEELMNNKVAFLITSEPSVDNVKEAANAGAIGVVAKPFDREELRKQLEKAERAIIAENTESF